MADKYFRKFWDETTGDELTDSWGTATYYFETDDDLNVLRQIQVFQNGEILKYDQHNMDDSYGGLADQPLESEEFEGNEIGQAEFFAHWSK